MPDHPNGTYHANVFTVNGRDNLGMTDENGKHVMDMAPPHPEASNEKQKKGKKKGDEARQMNIRGVFLHVLADALGSVVVIISAGVIMATDPPEGEDVVDPRNYVDPALSVFLVGLIMVTTWPLFRDTSYILMQTIPPNVSLDGLRAKLLAEMPEIEDIHEFHVWRLVGSKAVASLHARMHADVDKADHMLNAKRIKVRSTFNCGTHWASMSATFTITSPIPTGQGMSKP